jgi:hypothetical protein
MDVPRRIQRKCSRVKEDREAAGETVAGEDGVGELSGGTADNGGHWGVR